MKNVNWLVHYNLHEENYLEKLHFYVFTLSALCKNLIKELEMNAFLFIVNNNRDCPFFVFTLICCINRHVVTSGNPEFCLSQRQEIN